MAFTTYIIGNGLDLSLGLKTSYRDFYEHVKANKLHPDNKIYKAIAESPDTWSDFELSLGKYTEYVGLLPQEDQKDASMNLHEELEEIRDDLADYIADQENSVEEESRNLLISPNGYYKELPIGQVRFIESINAKGQRMFQFATLNYTSTLDYIIKNSASSLSAAGVRIMGSPHHIHGDLSQDMTLGVSDETQISQSLSGPERDDLIKPLLIDSMNDGRLETFIDMVNRSSVIVLYGTSIGESDKYIWRLITRWLHADNGRYIIIFAHNENYTQIVRRSSRKQKMYRSEVQEKLLRFSGRDGDAIEQMRKRIFVVHNTIKLFIKS
jgi:hypothetical protein